MPEIRAIGPRQISIQGAQPIARTFHRDGRGFLVEALRYDDAAVDGSRFRLSYSSVTLPGHFRDADRWHLHHIQTDRFVVILGEMMLALYDDREESSTRGRVEVIRMTGMRYDPPRPPSPGDSAGFLVPIPPGVLHCIGNLGAEPFLLQNFPTELYNPSDEGRVPFVSKPIAELGTPFSWELVERGTPPL